MLVTAKEYCDINNITDKNIRFLISEALKCSGDIRSKVIYDILNDMISKADTKIYHEQEAMIPDHYTKLKIEPINFIVAHNLSFCQGNIIKYLSRLGKKDSIKDELKKVLFYFTVHIEGNYDRLKG